MQEIEELFSASIAELNDLEEIISADKFHAPIAVLHEIDQVVDGALTDPEQWKPVPEYEGLYEVSSHGRVRSIDRWVNGRSGSRRLVRGRQLKPWKSNRGYLNITLCNGSSRVSRSIHSLVMEAFKGSGPKGAVVCHGDKGVSDNSLSNLRWDTQSKNIDDTYTHGRRLPLKGTQQPPREYTFESLEGETWLPVAGYEGSYEASNMGRIKSLDRKVDGRPGRKQPWRGQLKRFTIIDKGYRQVTFCKDGHATRRLVHHVILETFVGPRPEGLVGCHGNKGVSDNSLSNLRWDTPSSNMYDTVKDGTNVSARKTHCIHGHEYNDVNTVIYNGRRYCRICRNAGQQRRRAKRS